MTPEQVEEIARRVAIDVLRDHLRHVAAAQLADYLELAQPMAEKISAKSIKDETLDELCRRRIAEQMVSLETVARQVPLLRVEDPRLQSLLQRAQAVVRHPPDDP
jgi:hypothetical protein